MGAMSGLRNYTLATPLNKTETNGSVSLNTTLLPAVKSSTAIPLNNSTWHATSTTASYVPFGPPLITYSFTYSYAYYTFLLILLIAAIICIKMGMSRRKELKQRAAAQRRRALQQVESAYIPAASDNNHANSTNSASTGAKDLDLPPTYEDVVKSFMLTRQQDPFADSTPAENASGITTLPSSNSLSTAVSTLTIETAISDSNSAIAVHLNNPSNS